MKKYIELKLRFYFIRLMQPIIKKIGHWHLPYTHKRISYKDVDSMKNMAKLGYVLLSRSDGEASNLMIPGKYKHAAIYVGKGQVVESVGSGVRLRFLEDFMMTKDNVGLFMPKFANKSQRSAAAQWAIEQIGKPYDYEFMSDNESFYCFELTFAAYKEAMGDASPWLLRSTWGVPTVMGDDFINAKSKWEIEVEF